MKEYDQTFRDQLHHGIIERVEETQEQLLGQTHCMPHYAVISNIFSPRLPTNKASRML